MPSNTALTVRIVLFGFVIWLVPFLAGWGMVDETGQFTMEVSTAKTIFMLIGAVLGAYLIVRLFRLIDRDYWRWAWTIGIVWMGISWVLDIAVLLPLSGETIGEWFAATGARYFTILIMALLAAAVATGRASGSQQ